MPWGAFISYRRDLGSTLARLLKEVLEHAGFDTFLDVDDLGSGHFDRTLLREVEARENFVLVCTPGCLDRCTDETDFLRLEIAHALQTRRNIVPVVAEGFAWPDPRVLPESIRDLTQHHYIEYSHRHWDSAKEGLVGLMRRDRKAFRIAVETDPERFSACERVLLELLERAQTSALSKRPVEVRLLEPRATAVNPQVGLVESLRAANRLFVDLASPQREQMLHRVGIAIGLGMEFTAINSDPRGARIPAGPDGFPARPAVRIHECLTSSMGDYLVSQLTKEIMMADRIG